MFSKLSFEELSKFYGSLATLENHYGKEAVHVAVKTMSERLDEKKSNIVSGNISARDVLQLTPDFKVPIKKVDQLTLFEPTKEKKKPKRTKQRVNAEVIAKDRGYHSLEHLLIVEYFQNKKHQREIGEILEVDQTSISKWVKSIPQQTIKRIINFNQ